MAPARRAKANVEAPVWKSYLAVRLDAIGKPIDLPKPPTLRSRKRPKPTVVAPPTDESSANTRTSVRGYWEALSVQERMQVLFVDDPDMVKQLYKLNLSLLCVGLMQRHLKAGTAARVAATKQPSTAPTERTPTPTPPTTTTISSTPTPTPTPTPTTEAEADNERTYDLLEAMEFMDIGTGILTVKTELVEDVDRMFALISSVLAGFLSSVHLLSDAQYRDLFVVESEVIDSWDDYERLIAMLVEQLMLRGYVASLEREALQQMESLLLDEAQAGDANKTKSTTKKKKKNKKKTPRITTTPTLDPSVGDMETDAEPEPECSEPTPMSDGFACGSECSTEDTDARSGPCSPVKSMGNGLYSLNPHAQVFQPSALASLLANDEIRSPVSGKRKLDDFIIHVPWQDLVDGDGDEERGDEITDDDEAELGCRREDEDAELQWHLQHMYASTSSLFGWDFNQQREMATALPVDPWADAALFRTNPRDVVRFYFPPPPPTPHAFNSFPSTSMQEQQWPPRPVTAPPSRYYFTPPQTQPPTPPPPTTAPMFSGFMSPPSAPVSLWEEKPAKPFGRFDTPSK